MRTNQDWNHRVTLTALVHRIVEGLDTVTDFLQWRRQGVGQWRQPADPSSPCFTRNSVLDELSHSNFAIFFFLGQDKCPHRVRSHWPRKRTKFHKTQHVSTCNMWVSYGKNLSCHRCYVVPVLQLQLDILTADYLANTWLLFHIHMHQSSDLWSFDMFCLKQSVWASHQISSCKAVLSEKKLSMQKKWHTITIIYSIFIFWKFCNLYSLWSTDIPFLLLAIPSLLSKTLVGVFQPDVCILKFLLCVVCGFLCGCLQLLLDVNKRVKGLLAVGKK